MKAQIEFYFKIDANELTPEQFAEKFAQLKFVIETQSLSNPVLNL